jgi:hypothetical protein
MNRNMEVQTGEDVMGRDNKRGRKQEEIGDSWSMKVQDKGAMCMKIGKKG